MEFETDTASYIFVPEKNQCCVKKLFMTIDTAVVAMETKWEWSTSEQQL